MGGGCALPYTNSCKQTPNDATRDEGSTKQTTVKQRILIKQPSQCTNNYISQTSQIFPLSYTVGSKLFAHPKVRQHKKNSNHRLRKDTNILLKSSNFKNPRHFDDRTAPRHAAYFMNQRNSQIGTTGQSSSSFVYECCTCPAHVRDREAPRMPPSSPGFSTANTRVSPPTTAPALPVMTIFPVKSTGKGVREVFKEKAGIFRQGEERTLTR